MPTITESVHIAKDSDSLWHDIGAFRAVGAWHPMVAAVDAEGEQPGALRTAHGKDGSVQVERLLEMAPDRHAYRYEMVSTGMPVTNYVGSFQIEDEGGNESEVCWRAGFDMTSGDEAQTVAAIRAFLRAGLDSLASRYRTEGGRSEAV